MGCTREFRKDSITVFAVAYQQGVFSHALPRVTVQESFQGLALGGARSECKLEFIIVNLNLYCSGLAARYPVLSEMKQRSQGRSCARKSY